MRYRDRRWISLAATLVLAIGGWPPAARAADSIPRAGEMAGYLLVPHEKAPETYNAGFSLYVAAWPLLDQYPGNRFQTGLFGTWMHAQLDRKPTDQRYSDIEGGLGWWRDTRFATATPKFIMGGVALNFSSWANGPGAGKGRNWNKPTGLYGVAQLSPRVVWPPDGLNLKQGTCGELFGYGYLPLPLTAPKSATAGKNVPTGNRCWTLFLNAGNFKGPVAFFTPYFWSRPSVDDPSLAGTFLDSRPSDPNKALQMETQYVPCRIASGAAGVEYARVAPTAFPANRNAASAVVHRLSAYDRTALWDAVEAWFHGGPTATGRVEEKGSFVHKFTGKGGSTWRMHPDGAVKDMRTALAWSSFASPVALDDATFGFRWDGKSVRPPGPDGKPIFALPEYYRLGVDRNNKPQWNVVDAKDVPKETGLADAAFARPPGKPSEPYVTPDDPQSSWKKPGPAAGPLQAKLGDGSVITYYWYRFADQPAILNADLSDAERETLQQRVEKLHQAWTIGRDYLPPPAAGKLADLDPALIVTPPKGLEIGYVPIVARQSAQ